MKVLGVAGSEAGPHAVAGLPPEDAAAAIQERWVIDGAPDIYLDPAWRGIVPNLGSRIQVRVDYGQ